jgi:hypothetical protein
MRFRSGEATPGLTPKLETQETTARLVLPTLSTPRAQKRGKGARDLQGPAWTGLRAAADRATVVNVCSRNAPAEFHQMRPAGNARRSCGVKRHFPAVSAPTRFDAAERARTAMRLLTCAEPVPFPIP